ncbi:MAG: substrate-binding domain-containing protein [Zoogloeaceae bacterium]|nr:substrate-binding domain-containing protein [Zoogloeaceae bacterium]
MKPTRFVPALSACRLFLGCLFLLAARSDLFAADVVPYRDDLPYVPKTQRLPDEGYRDSGYARTARLALTFPKGAPALAITRDYPRLDGATAFAHVYMAAAQAIYRDEPIDAEWGRPPTSSPHKRAAWMISRRDSYLDGMSVHSSTTPVAYECLIQGEADMIFALAPSAEQREKAAEAGLTLKLTPFAREAFVFVTSAENPVDHLTLAQVRAIYSGQITNWKEVGGVDAPILAFQRPSGSGSQTIMETVMQGSHLQEARRENIPMSMGMMVRMVAEYRNLHNALGYSFRYYATELNPVPGLKLLAIDDVAPTLENVRNGSYPFTVEVYMVSARPLSENTQKLADWFLSDEGQRFVETAGYAPIR